MHKNDKERIAFYQNALNELGKFEIPGQLIERKAGFLRKRVVSTHFTFGNDEEAQLAKRRAADVKREVNKYKKLVKDDMKTIRRVYKEASANVGSGSGLTGATLGNKQRIIQAKAKQKQKFAAERDSRLATYEQILKQFDSFTYTMDSISSDANDFLNPPSLGQE